MRRRDFIAIIGSALACLMVAGAQQTQQIRDVGVLMVTSETDKNEHSTITDFADALKDTGWLPGKNIQIETRWAAGDSERLRVNAKEMVALAPDVIVAKGAAVPSVADATQTIPIVFTVFSGMLAQAYVKNFAHPNRNVTGFTSDEIALVSKRVEREFAALLGGTAAAWPLLARAQQEEHSRRNRRLHVTDDDDGKARLSAFRDE